MNATMAKFGYPGSVVKDYDHWSVLLRPQQVTLGSLVLASKSDATAFGQLAQNAYSELAVITADIERHLHRTFAYDKINYLMLMMVDPHVHLHVFPRYASARHFDAAEFNDTAWPGAPDLKAVVALPAAVHANLLWNLQQRFSGEL